MKGGNGSKDSQMLTILMEIKGEIGGLSQWKQDIEKFTGRINKEVKTKAEKADVEYLRRLMNGHTRNKTTCPVIKIHVAKHHNPDAELGRSVRRASTWIGRLAFWRRD